MTHVHRGTPASPVAYPTSRSCSDPFLVRLARSRAMAASAGDDRAIKVQTTSNPVAYTNASTFNFSPAPHQAILRTQQGQRTRAENDRVRGTIDDFLGARFDVWLGQCLHEAAECIRSSGKDRTYASRTILLAPIARYVSSCSSNINK
jgi:hypothetical protein